MSNTTEDRIKSYIADAPVILFMKGSPEAPQCGFSAKAVAALQSAGLSFAYIDVLQSPRIRETLPKISHFPTFPQLFIHQELIGGSDIIEDLVASGEIISLITARPVREVAS